MQEKREPLLTVRFDGERVGAARIPVESLQQFLDSFMKALYRCGRLLTGESESLRRGQAPRSIREGVALDLVLLSHGSPSVVLGFDRAQVERTIPGLDFGMEVLETALKGLASVQGTNESLPWGYDTGVLMAWRDASKLFDQGISQIEFTLGHSTGPIVSTFTPSGLYQIQERIRGHEKNVRTIEGRLLMADFKEYGTRCRVHPSIGEPVQCLFEDEKRDEVLGNLLKYVRVTGRAKEDPNTGGSQASYSTTSSG